MSVSLFDSVLTSAEMVAVFDDAAIVQAMLRFEAVLARAQARAGIIPIHAADDIAQVCDVQQYELQPIIVAARRAGSLAIPLVQALTGKVAARDLNSAHFVHWGTTSQDVIDTGMVLVTRDALRLIDAGLASLIDHLLRLGEQHVATPVLARTLLQPAQVTRFGLKVAGWTAPLVRARSRLRDAASHALQLQLGGAVGTLQVMGDKGPVVVAEVARELGLANPPAVWHTQRDEWVRLGLEVAVLVGSLGKIATDLSLLMQAEVAEVAEPAGSGRGGSSAMPHKRNPVSAMITLAAACRAPHSAAALLATMGHQHERGLGNWQAELAEWPGLFLNAHGALAALNDAISGATVNRGRMRRNIDALQGMVFAEAVSVYLAEFIGRPEAHALTAQLSSSAHVSGQSLDAVLAEAVLADPRLTGKVAPDALQTLFDPVLGSHHAGTLAAQQLHDLRITSGTFAAQPFHPTAMREHP